MGQATAKSERMSNNIPEHRDIDGLIASVIFKQEVEDRTTLQYIDDGTWTEWQSQTANYERKLQKEIEKKKPNDRMVAYYKTAIEEEKNYPLQPCWMCGTSETDGKVTKHWKIVPFFATNLTDTYSLIEEMQKRGYRVTVLFGESVLIQSRHPQGGYTTHVYYHHKKGETDSLAICKACLEAYDYMDDGQKKEWNVYVGHMTK